MQLLEWIKRTVAQRLQQMRLRLAGTEAQLQLALLGAVSGIIAGAVMVLFRLVIEIPQTVFLGTDNPEDYEHLAPLLHLLLPTLGGLLVGLLFQHLSAADRQVGVVHVMERLAYNEGHLPIKNAGVQFISAALCILAGHSVGREGPSIHVGATCGSWMGQQLRLPNNSIRILVGCGTAGAIAAAFNTPLAGVIFAMEVVLVEYTLASFTPIILAAVSATAVSRWAFGSEQIFVASFSLGSLSELFYIVIMGLLIGVLSTLFIRLLVFSSGLINQKPIWLRLTLAGAFTGVLALFVPEIMGIGYDTVNETLLGTLGLELLMAILVCKLLATAVGLGLGLPGGLIGPTLVMGAVAGAAVGTMITVLAPNHASPSTLYAMLGMGAMMGATLNAPLAALTALLELTANPHIILPGMLAIIAAQLTNQQGFKTPSVFLKLMQTKGLRYQSDPLSQFLRRLGVIRAMERRVLELPRQVERQRLNGLLLDPPTWLLVRDEQPAKILFAVDLIRYLEATPDAQQLDLCELPAHRLDAVSVSPQATLLGALQTMDREQVDALYVMPMQGTSILGVITRQDIERSYRYPKS